MTTFAINARVMRHADVAQRFVPPDFFGTVASRNHIVMLGPRGSGKTTLLTMLTRPALRAWPFERLGEPIEVDYIGVLVRADLTWSRQLRALRLANEEDDTEDVVRAAYVNHALLAITRYVRDFFRHDPEGQACVGSFASQVETVLLHSIAPVWRLPGDIRSLTELKSHLTTRSVAIWDAARTPRKRPSDAVSVAKAIDLFAATSAMGDALEELECVGSIALLLDELELLPAAVRDYVRTGLRDADERVLIKMSLSPVESALRNLLGPHGAVAGHDYIPVDLTYPLKIDGYGFTARLLLDLAERSGLRAGTIERLLGRSYFDLPEGDRRTARARYQPRGDMSVSVKELVEFDTSFVSYLRESNLDPSRLDELSEADRAALIRKVRDVVLVRNRFLRAPRTRDGAVTRTGVRTYDFYSGRDSVLALLEGNPRWVVNFVSSAVGTARPGSTTLTRARQARALADLIARVRSRVLHAPVPADALVDVDATRGQRVLTLVGYIASYFRDSILGEEFNTDPVLSFTVDDGASPEDVELVGDAVSHGAVIHVPRRDQVGTLTTVRGERFRLAYLIAAQYGLPPILGRDVDLTTIRRRSAESISARDFVESEDAEIRLFT